MKDKTLIGLATFFVTLVILLILSNFTNAKSNKSYSFKRSINEKVKLLTFEKKYSKMDNDEYIMSIKSNDYIIERDKEVIDTIKEKYKFYYSNFSFNKKDIDSIIVPYGSNILYNNKLNVIYTNNFKLYKLDKKTNTTSIVDIKGLKISLVEILPNSTSKYLCFAELKENKTYKTGFFVVDFITLKITPSKIFVEKNYTDVASNALCYSGSFSAFKEENYIVYYCNKYSKLFFFDLNGSYKKELTTADQTPLPSLIKNSQGFTYYKRGGTWNTNMGLFLRNNKVFVFSASNSIFNKIVIDEYSLDDLHYSQTFTLNYDGLNSFSIRQIFMDKNKLIIGFETQYASFIFSRHI